MYNVKCKSVVLVLMLGAFALLSAAQNTTKPKPSSAIESQYMPGHTYDPSRDAALDIERAIAEARKSGKHILLEVGGDWCPWCHTLDQFFQEHPDVVQLRDANFVVVNVYYGSGNKNEQVLSRYSKLLGIPHFFVLDKDGTLLHSQHVLDLKTDGDYDPRKMKDFLGKWSPAAR